uniref:TonB-dependent receptor n=1 Tax=Caulobacter sp. (strain K31) TaxID=366602 RepID=B0T3C8_CAUSK
MNKMLKLALLAGAAWSAAATTVAAQDTAPAPTSDGFAIEQVVVTARRREESLQDVPVAVSAFSAARLERTGAQDITELTRSAPSLTIQAARGSNSTLISFIRGIGQQDPLWGFEPGVGLYVDDVYIARPQAAVLDIFDISRIEVLRGPQGTLYGRNTIGGAIKYVTDKIGSENEATIKGAYGSYNQRELVASGKARLTDTWAVSGALARYLRDGYGKNLNTGAEHYNKDVWAGRASVEWQPTQDVFFRLAGDITRDDSNPRHGHREIAPIPSSVYDTNAGAGDKNKVEARGVSLLAQWDVDDQLTLKSITAYRAGETDGVIDFDNLPGPLLDIPAAYRDHQFSQELQALYEGDRIHAVGGVYYLSATASGAFDTVVGGANLTTLTQGYVDTESVSAFGDVSYDLTDRLSLSVGGRITRDKKTGNVFRQRYLGIRSPFFGNPAAIAFEAPRTNYTRTATFEKFTPRVSASYKFSPDLTGYASWGKGFKSGGFDMRGDKVAYPATDQPYSPENVETVELGLKGSLMDRRVTFATAVFDTNYKDMQITTQFPTATPGVVASVVDNVGSASIRGWELESSAVISSSFVANLMLSYIDAKFDQFLGYVPTGPANASCPTLPGCVVDLSAVRAFQNTPEWTGSASFTYTHDMGSNGKISFTPTASYRGAYQLFEAPQPILDQGAYWLYDASLVWTSADDRYQIGLHGKNLGDEEYRVGGYDFSSFGALTGNTVIGFYGPPRSVTLSLQAKF